MPLYNKKLKPLAAKLRVNMTDAEKLLWLKIRRKQLKGLQFYRQKIIDNYIVDFYCHEAKIVIEIDGGQHYTDEKIQSDKLRDKDLNGRGLTVLRYSNLDVLQNIDGVLEDIFQKTNPPESPFAKGGINDEK